MTFEDVSKAALFFAVLFSLLFFMYSCTVGLTRQSQQVCWEKIQKEECWK